MSFTLPVLVAKQITCEKQDRTLFQDIDLSIESGELVWLKGENGAGKTSLLRILVGLSEPVTGQVLLNEHDVHRDINLASTHFVYAGHKLGMNPLLNALENLEFWSAMQGFNCGQSYIGKILDNLGLTGLEDLPIKNLSAGQQRRVSLAKLWLNTHANLWVLDEPFTALDLNTVAYLEAHITHFLDQGGAVITTSHQAISLEKRARVFELEYMW